MRILYWFRRDLRLSDNRALAEAASRASKIVAVFVVDPEKLRDLQMGFEDPRFAFLVDILRYLSSKVRLHVLYGRISEVFEGLLGKYRFDAVFTASPLTWRDEASVRDVAGVCQKSGVQLVEILDNVLVDPSSIREVSNFTNFYKQWRKFIDARTTEEVPVSKFAEVDEPSLEEAAAKYGWTVSKGGFWRANWLDQRLRSFNFSKYAALRDYPYLDGSSRLSPYISLGAISVREIYRRASGESEEFVRQLAWREFYYYLKLRNPWMRNVELKPYMRNVRWENDKYHIEVFSEGKTGYPIVDAGIKQLKSENWVHNRVRLILANFFVKDLHVDWRIGEEFFKKYLVDYDEVLNVGNWQWAASVGVDPLPVRVFNPIRQAEKYDPSCIYIKKYLPELEDRSCRELHDPLKHRIREYYEPVVDHYEQVSEFKKLVGWG